MPLHSSTEAVPDVAPGVVPPMHKAAVVVPAAFISDVPAGKSPTYVHELPFQISLLVILLSVPPNFIKAV